MMWWSGVPNPPNPLLSWSMRGKGTMRKSRVWTTFIIVIDSLLKPFFFIPILLVLYFMKVCTEMHIQLLHWFSLDIMFLDAEGVDINREKCQEIMTWILTVKTRIIFFHKNYFILFPLNCNKFFSHIVLQNLKNTNKSLKVCYEEFERNFEKIKKRNYIVLYFCMY